MSDARIFLLSSGLAVELCPSIGGSIARFDRLTAAGPEPILRGSSAAYGDALNAGCFPLVPFANRIRGGSFACDGRTVMLPLNMAGDKSPIHGQGWQAPWTVEHHTPTTADLAYRHEADAWPWTYEARLRFELEDAELSIRLTCRNLSTARMPCGLGLHPYFVCDADTVLDTRVERAWTIDADVLPVESVAASGRYGLHDRSVCGQSLDNGFDGWSGVAEIRWPDRGFSVRMSSPDAGRFQLYSPPTGDLFVAEPVQNANCALNAPQDEWEDLGITMLEEGEASTLEARFEVL